MKQEVVFYSGSAKSVGDFQTQLQAHLNNGAKLVPGSVSVSVAQSLTSGSIHASSRDCVVAVAVVEYPNA